MKNFFGEGWGKVRKQNNLCPHLFIWTLFPFYASIVVHIDFCNVRTGLKLISSKRVQRSLHAAGSLSKIGERCSTAMYPLQPWPFRSKLQIWVRSPFFFILNTLHSPCPLPLFISLPAPLSLLLSLLSALSLLIMFWCSCCQRQHSQGTAPWETCKSVSLSTPFSFPFQPFIFIRQVNMSANYLLYSLYRISVGCVNSWNWIKCLVVDLAVKWDKKNTFFFKLQNLTIDLNPHSQLCWVNFCCFSTRFCLTGVTLVFSCAVRISHNSY